ncbi:hypothetical protein JOD82_001806 [Paenibacillus sp. 1182]|uniref:hypothetical protein n=1 Tax=Paenibacillus sp. 1182 TaxID=2806565 RepID=UPI001AE5F076|nr:hypothetical protein [Paenibacillus sp. 1182]MBP1308786.1 hypothetical protein [Paenibacillus sp. 1182]
MMSLNKEEFLTILEWFDVADGERGVDRAEVTLITKIFENLSDEVKNEVRGKLNESLFG